jgi:RimJ/RimL family protein N-acetyltransferase
MTFLPLRTARLRLEPVTPEAARAIVAGDLSGLTAGDGWPHEDTISGLSQAIESGSPAGWLVVAGDAVIGDCGTHGSADATGSVEIGYGLAAPYRGRGYGTETVAAITGWLLAQPEVIRVRARTAAGNLPSRRVLEKAGFRIAGDAAGAGAAGGPAGDHELMYEREAGEQGPKAGQ